MKHIAFVYGTLKKGFRNDHYLKSQKFLGDAETQDSIYNLKKISGGYPFPGLIENAEDGYKVLGECYEIVDECLWQLDCLEGVHEGRTDGLYFRKEIPVKIGSKKVNAIAYFFNRSVEDYEDIGRSWKKDHSKY